MILLLSDVYFVKNDDDNDDGVTMWADRNIDYPFCHHNYKIQKKKFLVIFFLFKFYARDEYLRHKIQKYGQNHQIISNTSSTNWLIGLIMRSKTIIKNNVPDFSYCTHLNSWTSDGRQSNLRVLTRVLTTKRKKIVSNVK